MLDQIYAHDAWKQIFPAGTTHNTYGATCTYDPVNGPSDFPNGGSGTFFLFGNEDDDAGAISEFYNPATNTYQQLGSTVLPTGCSGYGAGAVLGGISYCIGGGQQDTPHAVAGVFSWNNSQASNGVYVSTYAAIPTAASNGFAVAHPGLGLIFHGGGDANQLATPACLSTWYKWNPLTDTRTALHALPGILAGAACILIDNDTILVVGGFNVSQGSDFSTFGLNSVYKYKISTDTWTTMGNYPIGAALSVGCMWNGSPYVLSGWPVTGNGGGNVPANNDVYRYNVGSDTWTLHSTILAEEVRATSDS